MSAQRSAKVEHELQIKKIEKRLNEETGFIIGQSHEDDSELLQKSLLEQVQNNQHKFGKKPEN